MTVVDEALARRLVAACFPRWAHLPVRAVVPGGHDNRTFRLGDDLAVRLPSAPQYVAAVRKEQRWLPRLAERLPVPIPVPVGHGTPTAGFPWPWTVNRWLEGEAVLDAAVPDRSRFAADVGAFLVSLRAVEATDGPAAGAHSHFRGGDLAVYQHEARAAIRALRDPAEAAWGAAVLDRALASRWDRPAVWVHGDVAPGNLLVRDGRLAAVIDFGGCSVGDPACDLQWAWTWCTAAEARTFRATAGLDRATWDRAAGWALWRALIGSDPDAGRTLARLREDLPHPG